MDDEAARNPTSRAIAYHSTDYVLRYMLGIGSIFNYEYETMLIYLVIANSGVQHLINTPSRFAPYASLDTIVPIELQSPATRSAIARATGLPRETVRRKVAGMLASGLLTTNPRGGLFLTPGILSSDGIADLLAKNEADVKRLVRQVSPLM